MNPTLAVILNGALVNVLAAALTTESGPNGQIIMGLDQPDYWNQTYGIGGGNDCAPIRIDTLSPTPGIGWSYTAATQTFTSPDGTQTVTVPA